MTERYNTVRGPHQGQPILRAGEPLEQAQAAMVMVHGRGATAENILELAVELNQPGLAYLAPQAADNTWYPHSFLAPRVRQGIEGLHSSRLIRERRPQLLRDLHGSRLRVQFERDLNLVPSLDARRFSGLEWPCYANL